MIENPIMVKEIVSTLHTRERARMLVQAIRRMTIYDDTAVVLDMTGINSISGTAAHEIFRSLMAEFPKASIAMVGCNDEITQTVMAMSRRTKIPITPSHVEQKEEQP